MSAKRSYSIKCDGPGCGAVIHTNKAFVHQAREIVSNYDWWKLGSSKEKSLDFCSIACEDLYLKEGDD